MCVSRYHFLQWELCVSLPLPDLGESLSGCLIIPSPGAINTCLPGERLEVEVGRCPKAQSIEPSVAGESRQLVLIDGESHWKVGRHRTKHITVEQMRLYGKSHWGHFQLWNRINRLADDTDQSLTMIALDNIHSRNSDNVSCVWEILKLK